jgi:hypothetical protein
LSVLFRVAALVLFILAAVFAFGWVGHASIGDVLGYIAGGLAFWVASTLDTSPVLGR